MKKYSIVLLVALFMVSLSSTSCSKRCKGGGWYGDRNLGYAPNSEESKQTAKPIILIDREENQDISNP